MADSEASSQPPIKRRPGRPKGSKNKPDAGTKGNPVGRPRKNLDTANAKMSGKKILKEKLTGMPSQTYLFF
jgi:hypothetical protein